MPHFVRHDRAFEGRWGKETASRSSDFVILKLIFTAARRFFPCLLPGNSVIPIPLHPERSQGEEEEESYGCIAII
jgi:hypothetical protein